MPKKKITRFCKYCGGPFNPWQGSPGIFCSQPCHDKYRKSQYDVRFWNRVNKDGPIVKPELGPCWLWIGNVVPGGYGNLWYEDKTRRAHIVAYKITYGAYPSNQLVCHSCNIRHCVNPAHLYLDTHQGNMDYMVAQGRQAYNERSAKTVLSAEQVREIRKHYIPHVVTQQSLANKFGVAKSTIAAITQGKNRKHVT